MTNFLRVSAGSRSSIPHTITNSTSSSRRSPRSYFETKDCGTSNREASSTWLTWARLRTSRRKSPRLSFSIWKCLRYRTSLGANILRKVMLGWVITKRRIFPVENRAAILEPSV